MFKEKVQAYYRLTKPGIIRGNAITAIAGFLLASELGVNIGLFVAMLVGISFIIASACVVNNYLDRGLDVKMERTKKRALVEGTIQTDHAIIYAIVLGLIGFISLSFTNFLTICLALTGYFFYVVIYGIAKRRSVHGTLVGSISGAIPIVVGYCAVTNSFDPGAWILFMIMVFWQMPHFYAIAMFRIKDYKAANIPVLPIKSGVQITKMSILAYILAFTVATFLLTLFGYTGYVYLLVMAIVSIMWLRLALQNFEKEEGSSRWARKMFGFSLTVLLVFSIMISIEVFLP